jgi:hypothetical protein
MHLVINKFCGHIHLALEDMVLHCGMKMVLPHILKQLRGQNSCIVFLLFYLSHTIKMSVYLMHIRRVVFNCLVIGWTMGQAVILLKLLLIERHWNEIVIGERKIWRLFPGSIFSWLTEKKHERLSGTFKWWQVSGDSLFLVPCVNLTMLV